MNRYLIISKLYLPNNKNISAQRLNILYLKFLNKICVILYSIDQYIQVKILLL